MLLSESEEIGLLVCPALQTHVHYSRSEKKELAKLLRLDEASLPTYSAFISHGYLQNEGIFWRNFQSLRYHTYLISLSNYLKDTVTLRMDRVFPCSESMHQVRGIRERNRM